MADLVKWMQGMPKPVRPKDQPLPPRPQRHTKDLHPDEKKALFHLRREAKQAGASLHSKGEGGLAPSLVLGVMRRDKFSCVQCKGQQDLQVHHKTNDIEPSKKNTTPNVLTICHACHDRVHEVADQKGIDVKQALPLTKK